MVGVRRVTPLACFGVLLGLVALAPTGLRGADDMRAAWELVARHLSGEAAARLKAMSASGGRDAALAQAVVLMDSPRNTDGRMQEVAKRLGELAGGDDEIAQAAAYLIGRVLPDALLPTRLYAGRARI